MEETTQQTVEGRLAAQALNVSTFTTHEGQQSVFQRPAQGGGG